MGLLGSKETTQWNQPCASNIECGGCGALWTGADSCKGCGKTLMVPRSLESRIRGGTETTVLLGIPLVYPAKEDIDRLDAYLKTLDRTPKACTFFTQGAEHLSSPSCIMIEDSRNKVTFLYNPFSPVIIEGARLLRADPEDTASRVKMLYEMLVAVSTWPKSTDVNPLCVQKLRMNVLTHGPQRFHTSLFQESNLKYDKKAGKVKLRGGFAMVMSLTRRDAALMRDLAATEERVPLPAAQGLYMWTPSLLNMIAPPLRMPDFIKADKLLALSFFFKVPLVDRCDVLNKTSCLNLKSMEPIPEFTDADRAKYRNMPLDHLMAERAAEVLQDVWSRGKELCILWSGGIDSTSVVISFLRELGLTGDNNESIPGFPVRDGVPVPLLYVGYSEAAIEEYPWFYEKVLEKYRKTGVLGYVHIAQTRPVSLQLDLQRFQYITGECGDQMFGSDIMANAYDLTNDSAWAYSAPPNPSVKEPHFAPFRKGLEAHWKDTLVESLVLAGFLNAEDKEEWAEWIRPQLACAPFEIKTTFDILWWLNYTCKWQHVVLRILNFRDSMDDSDLAHVTHFFRSTPFQHWSFSNHHIKLPDKERWTTYKEPLKAYILSYTSDTEYYANKLKCGSLGYIMLQNDTAEHDILAIDSNFGLIKAGAHSLSPTLFTAKYGDSVKNAYLRRMP